MKHRSVWEEMTPQQREELKAYREKEYPYIPKWALRFHAPKKLSEAPEEIRAFMKKSGAAYKLFGFCPDEEHGKELRKYVNSLRWIELSSEWDSDKIIEAYLLSGENLMRGEYIYELCKRETTPKGHSFAIHPKEYWGRVEAKRRADISSFVRSRRERLLVAYLPVVEDAINLFFSDYAKGTDIEPTLSKSIAEYGLSALAESELETIELLALNFEIAVNWEELKEAETIRNNPDMLFNTAYLLPLVADFRECLIAGICSNGKDYLQRIDREKILSELSEHFQDLRETLSKVDKNR